MASVRALTDLTLADLWKEVKDPKCLKIIDTEERTVASKCRSPAPRWQRGSSQCARIRRIPSSSLSPGLTP